MSSTPSALRAAPALSGGAPVRVRLLRLDPRTKLLVLVVVNAITLRSSPTAVVLAAAVLVAALLLTVTSSWALRPYLLTFGGTLACFLLLPLLWHSTASAFIAAAAFWFSRFTVSLGMAGYVVSTTGASEMAAALRGLHVPQTIVIPFTVMLRFIPTVGAEVHAISDAMRLRRVFPGAFGLISHPARATQYLMVPLLASTTRLADDLSASALVRGLGAIPRPTSIVRLGLGTGDLVALLATAALIALRLSGWGVRA
ncbi:energy-coupling factor transporter transmembrane component T [Actinomyces polynesiensis]|uniref:energy-coupling factor transporter transmembrane component T n=1 Tax=Actinomyces polynesiensis TaxID=1325934 RepID=UPI000694E042|nr:energy-coupling factor transporter transmembrane component T [Actinomyces polynesiensis]